MDPLEASGALANQIIPLAERLLANHQPGAVLAEQPEFEQIRSLLQQAEQLLRGGLQDLVGQLKGQAAATREKAERLQAEQEAALVPKPSVAPLLALAFEAKETPPHTKDLIAELLGLPAALLDGAAGLELPDQTSVR